MRCGVLLFAILALCLACGPVSFNVPGNIVWIGATPTPEPTATSTACIEQARDYIAAAQKVATDWDAANALAGSTSRIALSGPVARLQDVRSRAATLVAPNCASEPHKWMLKYMDATIGAYLAFMAQDEATYTELSERASGYMTQWLSRLATIAAGK
jgi:hypothetical protein